MSLHKLTIECQFDNRKVPVTFYIGEPEEGHNPIHFQASWLNKERGGVVPENIMNNLQKLLELAKKNGVPFFELCKYALQSS